MCPVKQKINDKAKKELTEYLEIGMKHIIDEYTPLDLSFVFQLQSVLKDKTELFYKKLVPQHTAELDLNEKIIPQIEKKDVIHSYPFESMRPFISMLEEAGCQLLYGLGDYKVHSKLCLITRSVNNALSYITQIGTGNYNEKTSRLYTDLSLITANQAIGADAAAVFAALQKGETVDSTSELLVAPNCLQNRILSMIDEEIRKAENGEDGYIGVKINSLTDKIIIEKLIEASRAGVTIELEVRGICCLKPGVEGYTDNIRVVSVVGLFLEPRACHSNISMIRMRKAEIRWQV